MPDDLIISFIDRPRDGFLRSLVGMAETASERGEIITSTTYLDLLRVQFLSSGRETCSTTEHVLEHSAGPTVDRPLSAM